MPHVHSAGIPARFDPGDLAVVGEIAALLGGDHLWPGLDLSLRRLREGTGADAAELFQADPRGTEMFLVCHEGADFGAFGVRQRFLAGEGYPGIVLRTGAPVATTSLADDRDFLRARVKTLRYRTVIAVPVHQNGAVAACLLLAWKAGSTDMERALRVTALAARPVGAALALARARVRVDELERQLPGRSGTSAIGEGLVVPRPPAPEWRDELLQGGVFTLRMRDEIGPGTERAGGGRHVELCPAECTGQVQVAGGRAGWPCACVRRGCAAIARYCIPLGERERVWGIASVRFRGTVPVPLTRYLPAALWMAEDLAPGEPRRFALPRTDRAASPACLAVHCLGGFSVAVGDRSLDRAALNRAKAWELLAILVAAGGRPRSGRQLAVALWPEATDGQAGNRFHVTLSALRRAIEPPDRKDWTFVKRLGSSYYLDPAAPVDVDLWRFREVLRALLARSGMMPEPVAQAALGEAMALYAGDPFEGQDFGAWADDVTRWCRAAVRQARNRVAGPGGGAVDGVHAASAGRLVSPRTMLRSSPAKAIIQTTRAT